MHRAILDHAVSEARSRALKLFRRCLVYVIKRDILPQLQGNATGLLLAFHLNREVDTG